MRVVEVEEVDLDHNRVYVRAGNISIGFARVNGRLIEVSESSDAQQHDQESFEMRRILRGRAYRLAAIAFKIGANPSRRRHRYYSPKQLTLHLSKPRSP